MTCDTKSRRSPMFRPTFDLRGPFRRQRRRTHHWTTYAVAGLLLGTLLVFAVLHVVLH